MPTTPNLEPIHRKTYFYRTFRERLDILADAKTSLNMNLEQINEPKNVTF